MSSRDLETKWLSLRAWLQRCVLPAAVMLIAMMMCLRVTLQAGRYQDQTSLIIGFSLLYFVLIRGGHLIMIRSMHFDLKKSYGKKYEARLAALPQNLKGHNLGFTLARIKRDLIHSKP